MRGFFLIWHQWDVSGCLASVTPCGSCFRMNKRKLTAKNSVTGPLIFLAAKRTVYNFKSQCLLNNSMCNSFSLCTMFVNFLCVLIVYMFLCVQCLPFRLLLAWRTDRLPWNSNGQRCTEVFFEVGKNRFKAGVDRSHFFLQRSLFSVWVYLVDVIWHKIKSEEGKNWMVWKLAPLQPIFCLNNTLIP